MYSKRLLPLALSLFAVELVIAGPCKPISSAASSTVLTSVSESTTAILSLESSTGSETSTLDTTTETSKVETGTTTTPVASTATTTEVAVTTTETESSTELDTSTATTDATTGHATTTTADITTTTEAETTTTEAETTTTEAGCPRVTVLANPTPIFVADSDDSGWDETYEVVEVPFPVGVFGASSSVVYVSANGFLSLFYSTYESQNEELPSALAPSVAIMPYWDDLFVTTVKVCGLGINYEVHETERGQTFTVEYYVESSQGDVHFTVSFYKDYPGLVRYVYYATAGRGNSATVGVQNLRNGQQLFFEYSHDTPAILDNSFIEITTSTEAITVTSGQL
ncbi:hypothetical protein ACLX1H_003183 [Fusarium chlamydosporum]